MKYGLQIVFLHTKPKLEPVFYTDLSFAQYQRLIEGYKGLYTIELDGIDTDEMERTLNVKCFATPKEIKKGKNNDD